MFGTIELPVWLVVVAAIFALIAAIERALIPPVRWFFRRRMERVVARVNERLERPIEPFKLARRQDMIQQLIYHPDVMQAVAEHANEEDIPEEVAFGIARRYAQEIVPSFSASAYFGFAIRGAKFLSQALYRVRLGHTDKALADIDPEATVVFVMNHRSNMDYVLVTYLAARQSALSYAVGEWARIWPLSRFIRAMGAYFIRRKSRGQLYRKVLARYVEMSTQGGVTQAIFPEGGLSLNGKLSDPKLGLLAYVLKAWASGKRDVVFVPVAINYDRILEDYVLVAAGQRGDRKFGAKITVVARFWLNHLWLRLTGRYNKFGYAAASFGAPMSLTARASHGESIAAEDVAKELMSRISGVMPILPVPVTAQLLVQQQTWSKEDLAKAVADAMETAEGGHLHVPRNDLGYAFEVGLRNLVRRKLVIENGTMIEVPKESLPILAFYANSISQLQKSNAT